MPPRIFRFRVLLAAGAILLMDLPLTGGGGNWAVAKDPYNKVQNDTMLWQMVVGKWNTQEGWLKFYSCGWLEAHLKMDGYAQWKDYTGNWYVRSGHLNYNLNLSGDSATPVRFEIDAVTDTDLQLSFGTPSKQLDLSKDPSQDL